MASTVGVLWDNQAVGERGPSCGVASRVRLPYRRGRRIEWIGHA